MDPDGVVDGKVVFLEHKRNKDHFAAPRKRTAALTLDMVPHGFPTLDRSRQYIWGPGASVAPLASRLGSFLQ